ncbi:MAG: aminomethyl-transferring glycine dehydrogenase subunit GcvPA [Alphaproteobacteria bacterium]|nr:aminomethyl-transferring glycine dehydrogenase subunit GcvPA [Alphaproteobacteria bacterium]
MRYLPLGPDDRRAMLGVIGAKSVDDLFKDIPQKARVSGLLDLPMHAGELEVERTLGAMAAKNRAAGAGPSFLGAGSYRHHIPSAVDHLIQRSEFLTSYTPYQPEVAQGTLQFLFEFQTNVAMLSGMEVANASMYEGGSSCAEAVLMAGRVTGRPRAILSGALHPHYRDTVRTFTQFSPVEVEYGDPVVDGKEDLAAQLGPDVACVVVQTPDFFGNLHDYTQLGQACRAAGALLVVVVTEVVSLGALKSPGQMGADIFAGEGQSLGVGLNFGGPYVGLFATRRQYIRQMPGRLCGETVDADGRRSYVLTLSTREQHIRREKATSNICTNSGLCALAFGIHVSLLGEEGMRRLAKLNHAAAVQLAEQLGQVKGVKVLNKTFFNEFTVELPGHADEIVEKMVGQGVLAGVPVQRLYRDRPELANLLLVAASETNTDADRAAYVAGLKKVLA